MSMYATIELSESGHQGLPHEFDPNNDGAVYGQDLPKMSAELDALAEQLGVRPISAFLDDSDMLDEEEREEVGLPPAEPKWAPVEDGLRTIRALITALTNAGRNEDELWDLRVSERILSSAKTGEKFRYNVL
jgi:hypothetical protein